MKINPAGILNYQQSVQRQDGATGRRTDASTLSNADVTTSIAPKQTTRSELAVKAEAGSYARQLSPQERQALDMLFAKYHDSGRFGAGYQEDIEAAGETAPLGNWIDVKA